MKRITLLLASFFCLSLLAFLPIHSENKAGGGHKQKKAEKKDTNWVYTQEEDKMSSHMKYYAYTLSKDTLEFDFPHNGGALAYLCIRNTDSTNTDIMLEVTNGQFITTFSSVTWRIRFDNNPAETCQCFPPKGLNSKTMFLSPVPALLAKIKTSKKVVIEAEFFNDGLRQIEFDTHGLVWNH